MRKWTGIGNGGFRCFRRPGLQAVLDTFNSDHIKKMDQYPARFIVLLIDFDGKEDRLGKAKAAVPAHLSERGFILGAQFDPENLTRSGLGKYEEIGAALAKDCREDSNEIDLESRSAQAECEGA